MAFRGPKGDLVSLNRPITCWLMDDNIHNGIERTKNELVELLLRELAEIPRDAENCGLSSVRNYVRVWTFGQIAYVRQYSLLRSVLL